MNKTIPVSILMPSNIQMKTTNKFNNEKNKSILRISLFHFFVTFVYYFVAKLQEHRWLQIRKFQNKTIENGWRILHHLSQYMHRCWSSPKIAVRRKKPVSQPLNERKNFFIKSRFIWRRNRGKWNITNH